MVPCNNVCPILLGGEGNYRAYVCSHTRELRRHCGGRECRNTSRSLCLSCPPCAQSKVSHQQLDRLVSERHSQAGVWNAQLCCRISPFHSLFPAQSGRLSSSLDMTERCNFPSWIHLIGCVLRAVFSSSMIMCLPTSSSSGNSRVFL